MKNFNFGIMAVVPDTGQVIHAVGYEVLPETIDWVLLHKELHEDVDLGCVGQTFILVPAPADALEKMNEILRDPDTNITFNDK